jgi:hypothetical protein
LSAGITLAEAVGSSRLNILKRPNVEERNMDASWQDILKFSKSRADF